MTDLWDEISSEVSNKAVRARLRQQTDTYEKTGWEKEQRAAREVDRTVRDALRGKVRVGMEVAHIR